MQLPGNPGMGGSKEQRAAGQGVCFLRRWNLKSTITLDRFRQRQKRVCPLGIPFSAAGSLPNVWITLVGAALK